MIGRNQMTKQKLYDTTDMYSLAFKNLDALSGYSKLERSMLIGSLIILKREKKSASIEELARFAASHDATPLYRDDSLDPNREGIYIALLKQIYPMQSSELVLAYQRELKK